ncbi:MAG: ATP-binding protein [Gemmatimonadales bacterium]|nr:ATP-binding protein [Gemmatimonadales bacterium]
MITRDAAPRLADLARHYPVVSVTGPRQSGKTTLCRATFPDLPYVSLEPLDVREFATSDPRGFLASLPSGAIIDEVQRAPDLFSYLQAEVDANPASGRFILTGSQQLGLLASVTQSLAGRTGLIELYPPSWAELKRFPTAPTDLFEALWTGAYPRIFDRGIPPHQWLADYVATYVQRDVRQVLNVGDLRTFTTFLQLCAGSTAGEVHLSRLGADAGIAHNTAKAWLSILEATYLVVRVPGWHPTFRKQVVKSAKLHFVDSGVASYLLGIKEPEQLRTHPLRGALFESWVAAELVKRGAHQGLRRELFHYRDAAGLEVDLVSTDSASVTLVEAKSGATIASDWAEGVERLARGVGSRGADRTIATRVIHGGTMRQTRGRTQLLPWREIDQLTWTDGDDDP